MRKREVGALVALSPASVVATEILAVINKDIVKVHMFRKQNNKNNIKIITL